MRDTFVRTLVELAQNNHNIELITGDLGFEVLKLKRESISFLTLDGVKSGEYRQLSIKEVKKLYGEKNNQD